MVPYVMPFHVSACGLSDIGLVRQNNEDVWAQVPEYGFYVLADGMGGHQAGEIAAREAVEALCQIVRRKKGFREGGLNLEQIRLALVHAIEEVNTYIYKLSRTKEEFKGMGTTLCCLLFHEKALIYANVGDSRIYRFREKNLDQITKDHSLLREMMDLGQINERQAEEFAYKNVITRAIGTESKVDPSVNVNDIQPQDVYIICSDGLSDQLSPSDIYSIISSFSSLKDAVDCLVATANEKGGHDNITVVLARVEADNDKESLS